MLGVVTSRTQPVEKNKVSCVSARPISKPASPPLPDGLSTACWRLWQDLAPGTLAADGMPGLNTAAAAVLGSIRRFGVHRIGTPACRVLDNLRAYLNDTSRKWAPSPEWWAKRHGEYLPLRLTDPQAYVESPEEPLTPEDWGDPTKYPMLNHAHA